MISTSISVVLTPCSARKEKLLVGALDSTRLPPGSQADLGKAWVASLKSSGGQIAARDLYRGASFSRLRRVAESVGCPLFVISAGLGLVEGNTHVPAYDLTLSSSAPTRLQARVTNQFDAAAWWQQVQRGPFASSMEAIGVGEGRILISLSKPYAQLISGSLAQLPSGVIQRLRIFGEGLEQSLSAVLRAQVMPYDKRLDLMVPGTRLDFPSRALAHFTGLTGVHLLKGVEEDAARVRAALASMSVPPSISRCKTSDEELLKHIAIFVQRGLPSSSALRQMRGRLGVACEQGRFNRLYKSIGA